jgi:hypothetical protein
MLTSIDFQKGQTKEKMIQEIDDYYLNYTRAIHEGTITIDKIEHMMVENQKKMKSIMQEANEELCESILPSCKKNAQNAEAFMS